MEKFQRNYVMQVEAAHPGAATAELITIEPPFTVEFDIERSSLIHSNTATFRVYNLGRVTRDKIRKNLNDPSELRAINFRAGYLSNLNLAFTGTINQAWSVREGTNFITEMECFDAGFDFVNAETNRTFGAGTSVSDALREIAQDFPTIQMGAIGNLFKGNVFKRGNSFTGSTFDALRQLTGDSFFVDNNRLYILAQNECITPLGLDLIDAQTGLLNTPLYQAPNLTVEMLFEPGMRVGQSITLQSVAEPWLNGLYKVVRLHHRGIISEAVGGEAITEAGFLAPFAGSQLEVLPQGAT